MILNLPNVECYAIGDFIMIIQCANCGKEYESEKIDDGFCSDLCREATQVKLSEARYHKRFNPKAIKKKFSKKNKEKRAE